MTTHCSVESGVGSILIDRPDVKNAINPETLESMRSDLRTVVGQGARALVLGGKGGFCAGADLALVKQALQGDAASVLGPMVDELHGFIRELRELPIPVVAALEGPAVGAGMGLALSADVRVAGRSTVLIPGYFGIGTSPDGGVSYFLTRALGGARAMSLILQNSPLRAVQLEELGLVEEIVEDGAALQAATDLAARLAGAPPAALVYTRGLIDRATSQVMDTHLDDERAGVAALWTARDFTEGVTAFLERRTPEFTGE
ncbi:MAG: enoyl-CoA hydratase/isomerase family protein [Microthrixaceae bacterium]